jgi:hypothetical protein
MQFYGPTALKRKEDMHHVFCAIYYTLRKKKSLLHSYRSYYAYGTLPVLYLLLKYRSFHNFICPIYGLLRNENVWKYQIRKLNDWTGLILNTAIWTGIRTVRYRNCFMQSTRRNWDLCPTYPWGLKP